MTSCGLGFKEILVWPSLRFHLSQWNKHDFQTTVTGCTIMELC